MNEDHKEVQLELLANGVHSVREWIIAQKVSDYSVKKALRELKKSGRASEDLLCEFEGMLREMGILGASGKPQAGERRAYKVNDSGKGTSYVRLPVDALGLKPGDLADAEFFLGEIRVKPGE